MQINTHNLEKMVEDFDPRKHFAEIARQFTVLTGMPAPGEACPLTQRAARDKAFEEFEAARRREAWALWQLVFGYLRPSQEPAPRYTRFFHKRPGSSPAEILFRFTEAGRGQGIWRTDGAWSAWSAWPCTIPWTLEQMESEHWTAEFPIEISRMQAEAILGSLTKLDE